MKAITIFYDPRCGVCAKFRAWLEAQPTRVEVAFIGFNSPEAEALFPGLMEMGADRDLVVLADDGKWWQGSGAWLTCLWATASYYEWSFRLASPVLQPLVKQAIHLLSENRLTLSHLLRLKTDSSLAHAINSFPSERCENGTCQL